MNDRTTTVISKWNRKLHMYSGLYMLLFLWFFSISGLFMNHPDWFKNRPERVRDEQPVQMPDAISNFEKTKTIMQQLNMSGEIIFRGRQKPGQFTFIVVRPNKRFFVNVILETNIAQITNVDLPTSAIITELHTFSGIRGIWGESKANSQRDWLPTIIWSISMDALCVGLIFMVASSIYMAVQVKQNRVWCLISFVLGVAVCSFFIWGLA